MKKVLFLIILLFGLVSWIQAQQGRVRHRNSRPGFGFQSFGSSIPGFSGGSSSSSQFSADVGSDLASQLSRSGPPGSAPEYQEQPRRGNEVSNLPLYKQSYPGLYVKGHTVEDFKYEPTRQVAHHHGPDYQFPRNIAQSSRNSQGFAENTFSEFN